MTAKKHLLLGSMMFALSACGGSDEQQPQASTQAPTSTVNPPAVASYVNLAGVLASNKTTQIQILGENTASRGAVGSAIANSQATIGFTQAETVQGNVSFLLNARDPDGISEINLVLPSVNKSLPICSSDCGNEYERSVIGLSPSIYGASAGELRLEIWITDTLQNQVLADAITFSWQPHQIVGVTAQREDQGINLTWQANTELNRYNVYIATQPGVSPSNVDELENGQQFLSISDPFFAIPNTITNKSYQALITGIDGSGESGFSNLINIAPLGGELAFAPTANNDIFEIDEDTALQGNVLTNDTNPYSGQLLANTQVLVTPSHGSVTMTESGDFTYQPALNFNGEDAFSYQIINELGRTDTAVVAITINPINDAPTALDNTYNISSDGTLTVSAPGLLGNDSDVDLDELRVDETPVNEPLRGQLTLFSNGSFEYQGEQNMQGEDSFQYKVIDNQGGEATATVFIVSTNTNSAPVANNDSYNVNEDNTLVISAENGVLSNDTDPNGDTFTVDDTFIVAPTHGQLLLSIDGSFSYIPDANFNGVDQFQYAAIDSQGASATATVTVIVNSQPDNPVAQNDAYQFSRNNLFSVSAESGLLANDFNIETGELTVDTAPVTEPQNGTLNLNSDGSFTYQPNADFSGVDSFSYSISNDQGLTATAQVTLSESGNNTFPEASDDQFTIAEDSSATQLNVLANDSDADDDTITLFNVNSTLGSASIVNGQIEYTPPANFSGQTVLTYSITDGYENGSPGEKDSTASVTIIVTPVNDAPIANADLATINEDAIALLIDVLANDSDIDDDSLILSEVSADSGTALIVENKIQYTPAPNANGVATVAYSIKDAQDANATSTLSITILPINDAPVATADTATMDEDVAPITIDVLANDSDVDGDSLAISTAIADEGTATIVNNQIQYTPAANANGVATVTYTASDNNGGTASSTLAITINPINDAPVATADTATMDEDAAPITIDVLANDSDVDGDSLVISNASADEGTATIVNNQIQYTPAANANGVATVTYTASDNNGGTANSTLAITINPVNDAPVATADTATMNEDAAPITIDVLANDSDVDGDGLVISNTTADVGAVSVVNNQIQYTPAANANGVATVTYTASDNNGGTASSTVAITINPINDAPVATADTATMDEDAAPITIDVLANDSDVDGDSLAISTASADVGTATIVNNQIQYTPAANANGVATVTYTASDNNGGTASSTFAITINPINDVPVATADTATMDEDAAPITIDVLANDSDVDGDSLVISTASADEGTATIVNNQIQYTPAANANGVATVIYTASDNNGGTASSTLAITINPINDAPVATADTATMNEDAAPITIDVLANDSDVDGDSLVISTASADVGSATIVNNQIQYTPAANANGVATVTYTASDNNGGTASSTLAITINPINDAPVATADTATMDEDAAPITIDVLANDSDVDGDSLVISNATADVGAVSVVNNQIQYTPEANANGVATVAYTASDNNGGTANSTLAITINPINDAPIVAEQSFSINEDATDSDIIGTIVATDNENQDLTYVLAGGDLALFNINASSGILSVNGETPFDYETKTQYILNIQVTDNGTPNETTAVNITVNIIDVVEPLIPVEDTSFGRPITGQLDLGSVFSGGQFNDSIALNNNLYFVGFTNNADKDILIVSYTNNGDVNTAFNTTGTKVLDLEQDEEATAIISDGTDLFIAYSSFDGSNNEACVLKMDLAGALRTGSDDGESNTGIKCTTLNSTSVINDLEVNGSELVAVGKHFDGTQTDSLWIHYKTDDLSFENSTPAIVDVSGANRDDEGYAVKNFENSDYLVVGSVTDADGTKNSLLRYLKANGDNDGNFNGGDPLIINLSSDLGQPGNNKDDELFAIGGLADSNFTAFAGGYMTRQTGEKEAVVLAIDKNGELVTSFDTDGIAIYDIDGESGGTGNGVINGGAQVTGIQYEPIKNEIMLSGTTGIPIAEHVFTARVISSTGLLDDTYGESGVSILSGIDAKQTVNTTSIDSNDTLWVAGIDDDTNAKPFIGAITDQAALFTNFNSTGYLTVDEISEASNDKSMKLIQLSNGAQAGKYMLASTAETNGVIKLVLTRFTSTGAIDTSFSKTGHKEIAIELNSQHVALAELNNGNLLLAGTKKTTNGSQGFVAKVDQDGSLDTTFATDGIYVTNIENTEALTLSDIAITNSNNIVAVGTATQSANAQSFAMMLTAQGVLATSFGTEGVLLGLTGEDFSKIHIDNNEIFIAGELVTGADSALIALKLNLTGNELFRYSGTDTPNINNKVASVLTDSSGAIYLVANLVATPDKANVVRLLSSGSLDTSFADNGVGQYSLAVTGNTLIKGAKLDSTDKLILVGTSNNQGVIARITTNGELDNTFGTSGVGYYQANLCTNSLVFSSLILQTDTQIALSSTCDNGSSNNISVSKFDFYPDGVEP